MPVRHAGEWFLLPHLTQNEYRVSAKNRLGVPVYKAKGHCPFCKADLDLNGDHAFACHGRGDAIARHNRIGDKIVSAR